ncbi:MAG: hypothetical protein K2X87_35000 [Gemmataceae bacterium]|nr:hypothetical protein [Gemmataceae bacterium]
MSFPPRRPVLLLILAAAFAAAHTQAPLFYSNQNQYLLHGLAAAGYGHLSADWLANTEDPTPLFSVGVGLAYQAGGLWPLQAGYFVLLMGYFLAAWWLVSAGRAGGVSPLFGSAGHGADAPRSPIPLLAFAALFTAAHAGVLRWLSVQLTGVDYPWYFQVGVAGQYVLGPGLQPSAFGVLLVVSLAAFANGRPVLAGAAAGAAGLIHATYLLPAALLTVGYVAATYPGSRRRAAGTALAALAVAAPMVAYALVTFPPSGGGEYAESRRVLAEVRIPHHAAPARWFDAVAAVQCGWVVLAILAVRRSRLAVPLAVGAAGGTILTLVQVATGDHALALVFPWRVSAVLVPVATAILAAKVVARLPPARAAGWASGVVIAGLVAGGVAVMALGLGYRVNEEERPLLEWVKETAEPDEVYLIPAAVPAVGSCRGAASTSFTPPPRPKPGSNLIPIDLQQFRLATGKSIYVDFKSVPYGDAEVLEWLRRVRRVEGWYADPDWDRPGLRDDLRSAGITHVLVPRDRSVRGSYLEPEYEDEAYTVYRVK